jgi:hypothetical protein
MTFCSRSIVAHSSLFSSSDLNSNADSLSGHIDWKHLLKLKKNSYLYLMEGQRRNLYKKI